eukprot:TRINITY_DN9328_c0_g1_i2.p1 TRINITY_DN9328_c0_g1~~TRINITY_DN9328_c0_g1_i2.p1  ORF type:complete len:140 (+),score=10.78 TRINITY_DN9328_c0_g1_i2:495-914(+)
MSCQLVTNPQQPIQLQAVNAGCYTAGSVVADFVLNTEQCGSITFRNCSRQPLHKPKSSLTTAGATGKGSCTSSKAASPACGFCAMLSSAATAAPVFLDLAGPVLCTVVLGLCACTSGKGGHSQNSTCQRRSAPTLAGTC